MGPALQVAFLCGAALLLFALFSSESFRSRAKHFIVRNFYTAKYDYRREWMRFIGSLSSGSGQKTLQDRIVHAFAEVMDSRGAGLWVLNEAESAFAPTANWNFGDGLPKEPHGSSFVAALGARERLWTVKSVASEAGAASPFVGWLFDSGRASLILPLMHHDRLYAFVVLGTSRVDVAIDDADEELLLVLGRQAASYLAEEKAASALLEAKRWEEMNKRFAFVAHDVKNVVNQLSLLVHNAEAHGRNPAFQADMLATIGASVDRMKLLLQQLRSKRETTQPDSTRIPLDNCLKRIGDNWRTQNSTVNLELGAASVRILGNENRFVSAVDHLMQNAVDAGAGRIVLRSRHAGDKVEVEVEDEGPGMDAGFVRDRLFRPLNSSKHSGFGMGVYQVRQYVRDMGGELIVDSVVGKGTKMCIRLPALAASGAADRPIEPFA